MQRSAVASLAAFGAALVATSSTRRSTAAGLALAPKPARLGRESFAAHLGRALAARGVVCTDRDALRRLDRVDTLLVDAPAITTGDTEIATIHLLGDDEPGDVRRLARQLFSPTAPLRGRTRRVWSLGPLRAQERRELAHEIPHAGPLLGLREGRRLAAVVVLRPRLDPLAASLVDVAHRAEIMVAIAGDEALARRLGADLHVPGGAQLGASAAMLQEDGCGVMLVAPSGTAALAAADVGVALPPHASSPGAAADVLAGTLSDVVLLIDAAGVAHEVSRQSVAISLAGSSIAGVLALAAPPHQAAARTLAAVNGAAFAALANGLRAATGAARRPVPVPVDVTPWHELDPDEVLVELDAPPTGLSTAEAERRLQRARRTSEGPVSLPVAVLEELANPMTPVLAGAAALSTAVGSVADAAIVGGVLGVNALVGGVQRVEVEAAVRRLEIASAQRIRVERDGTVTHVPADVLVPGDTVAFEAGDSVAADCRILEASGLEVDESGLTGESVPVAKSPRPSLAESVVDRSSMLYDGTSIAAGSVRAAVVATGIGMEARRAPVDEARPGGGVEQRLEGLMRLTLPLAGIAGAGLASANLLRGGRMAQSLHGGVSLAVAAVPEGLPVLATIAQVAAARRLAARGALVKNPRAIEALGRVDLVCCDKTGTLTEGRIELHGVFDGEDELDLGHLTEHAAAVLAAALRASPAEEGGGDPLPHLTDRAVVNGAARHGVHAATGVASWSRRAELPFEPGRGYHAVLGRNGPHYLLSVKGAPEVVLPRCSEWQHRGERRAVDDVLRARLVGSIDRLARSGYRVLAVAERQATTRRDLDDERVDRLRLLGFLTLSDPVRPTAAASVAALAAAGVRTVMVTGDHPSTAEGIAAELGLLNGHRVLTGPELDAMSDRELDAVLDDTSVFARVAPAHKMRIVQAYRARGGAVAMTGDGANDAPAIRLADAGVALGDHATSAARAAADVVVPDGRIETLVDAIVEGRAMWASVRDAIAVLVGGNVGEILFVTAAGTLGPRATLTARQLLLVNLLTDAAPALAMAVRPPRGKAPDDLLREGPEASLGRPLERAVLARALATALGAGVAWTAARFTGPPARARTTALVGLVGGQLGQTLAAGGRDPYVLASSLASAAVLAAIVQTPGVSQFFGCTPLDPLAWTFGTAGTATATALSTVLPGVVARIPRFADPA